MLFKQFSNIIPYVIFVGGIPNKNFNAPLSFNPGDKVLNPYFLDLAPWIGEQRYNAMVVLNFSNHPDVYVGKLPEQHFSV